MDKIIVTGGSGFIGRHLVRKLLSKGMASVILISNTPIRIDKYLLDEKLLQDRSLKFYTTNITDGKTISDIFLKERAETCIHLAAKTSVVDSIKNPDETLNINVNGTINVLEACYNSKVENFLFASSAAVYGDVKELPIREESVLNPSSPYGTSKMLAEQHVTSYRKSGKIQNVIMLRIFNVYGKGQASRADVVSRFAKRLQKGLAPLIYGSGVQTRDLISIDDVIDAIMKSVKAMELNDNYTKIKFPSVFNIGSGVPISINELAKKMIHIFNLELQPTHEKSYERNEILHSYADVTKAKEHLNFVPKKGIDEGLREMLEPIITKKQVTS